MAEAVVAFINDNLSKAETLRMSCAKLQLKRIHSAFLYEPNEKVQAFESTNQDTDREVNFGSKTPSSPHYQVTVQTSPGNALFEATVIMETKTNGARVTVDPNISRTNEYGDQAKCIIRTYPYARKFCFCLKAWKLIASDLLKWQQRQVPLISYIKCKISPITG